MMESHLRQVTYHSNKIQEPSHSTFRKRMGHLNGVLICDGLVGCCASPVKEKIVTRITGYSIFVLISLCKKPLCMYRIQLLVLLRHTWVDSQKRKSITYTVVMGSIFCTAPRNTESFSINCMVKQYCYTDLPAWFGHCPLCVHLCLTDITAHNQAFPLRIYILRAIKYSMSWERS